MYKVRIADTGQIQIRDFDNQDFKEDPPAILYDEHASNVLLSSESLAACVYKRHVKLWYLPWVTLCPSSLRRKTDFPSRKGPQEDLHISTEKDFNINGACFSGNGRLLCIWASEASANHAYFYNVDSQPPTLHGKAMYVKVLPQRLHGLLTVY